MRRALPSVINALESPHPQVRVVAAQLIGSHGQAAAQAVPVLMGLLENADGESRLVVIRTLGQIGPSAEPAFNQLTSFLDDADRDSREMIRFHSSSNNGLNTLLLLDRDLLAVDGRTGGHHE